MHGIDGWVISVHERSHDSSATVLEGQPAGDARAIGLTVARRYELAVNEDSSDAHHSITLYCTTEELAGFRLACAEASRAELEMANPLAGLRHYRTAMLAFPFLPGLDALRDQLMASAWKVVDASLQSAGECLKERRTWVSVLPALERARTLIEIEDTLQIAFAARYELLHSIQRRLSMLMPFNRLADAPHEEHDILRDLYEEMAGDPESYWHMPGWRSLRERLNRLDGSAQQMSEQKRFEARRLFFDDAGRAYNDASSGRFLERYLQAGNPPPPDEAIAQLQYEESEALLRRAEHLMHLHNIAEENFQDEPSQHDATMHAAAALLHEEINKLEGWRRDLRALLSGLSIARHRATLGLRDPEQIDVARYVLCAGGRKAATALRQVPHMFVGHPSLLQCKAYVDHCEERRKAQERLFREITLCLQFDAAIQPAQLAMQGGDDMLFMLQSRLQSETDAIYPIEVAWEGREMKRREPADACGLQKELVYLDSDDHGREHVSLPAIEAVVHRKVRQIHCLRDWLHRFKAGSTGRRAGNDFPGAVDWEQEKKDIETQRESGPVGLMEAQARCKVVKSGDDDGTVNGLWPLERMCRALSQDSALAHLQQALGDVDPDATTMPLCAAAQALNHERHLLLLMHERHLRECDMLAKDIASRIEQYADAWDAFEAGYRALMSTPWLRRRRIAESSEWQHFQQVTQTFCGICANYSVFRSRLHEVKARFKLEPECLDGRLA